MTKKKQGSIISFSGIFAFFCLIAFIIQVAVLFYDYIRERTDDPLVISVLILNVILMLSVICTVIDTFRRRFMNDKPIEKIIEATDRIAHGDFSVRIDIDHSPSKYNGYDYIMENLNTMAAELNKSELMKNDFISNVSHELKTPLSVIQSYVSLLGDDTLDDETRDRYYGIIVASTKKLSVLITDILQLNKLESQEIKPDVSEFDLTESISEAILSFEPIIEKKEISLECELDDIRILSSESLLLNVWNNLISNALKFTDDKGNIYITLKNEGRDVVFRIKDSGCGISSEVGAKIFEKFYQGDTSHSSEGNGLGLALVKRVIDILGGEIEVESEVGVGATFAVTLRGVVAE